LNRSKSLALSGFAAALLTTITVALGALGPDVLSLHLVTAIKWVLAALFAFVVALAAAYTSTRTQRAAAADALVTTTAALVGGPAQLQDHTIAEFGLKPQLAGRASQWVVPGVFTDAIRSHWFVCTTGPDGVQTAACVFKVLKRDHPDLRLLVPVDGEGLNTMLEGAEVLRDALVRAAVADAPWWKTRFFSALTRPNCAPTVIWLDDLDRFVSKLDVERLRDFVDRTAPKATTRLRLLVTMQTSAYNTILQGDGEEALHARRLLAHAYHVGLQAAPARPSVMSPTQPRRRSRQMRLGRREDSAPTGSENDPGQAPDRVSSDSLPPAPILSAWTAVLLAVSSGLLIALASLAIYHRGLDQPPSLNHQAGKLVAALQPCETAKPGQPVTSLHKGEDWVFPVDASSCPGSDYVSIYANDSGHLDHVVTEHPQSKSTWSFRCAVVTNCALSAGGTRRLIIGAFMRTSRSAQVALPLVLYASSGPRDIQLLAPELPKPNDKVPAIVLKLPHGAPPDQDSSYSCPPAEVCGPPATYITALPEGAENASTGLKTDVLLIEGDTQNSTTVITRAFVLKVSGRDRTVVRFGQQPCRYGTLHNYHAGHHYYRLRLPPRLSQREVLKRLRKTWTGRNISCPKVPVPPAQKLPTAAPGLAITRLGR
jgi:hypothetical protein